MNHIAIIGICVSIGILAILLMIKIRKETYDSNTVKLTVFQQDGMYPIRRVGKMLIKIEDSSGQSVEGNVTHNNIVSVMKLPFDLSDPYKEYKFIPKAPVSSNKVIMSYLV